MPYKLKTKSHFSTNLDPYRAGSEIGAKLAGIRPEVVFLFTSLDYDDPSEILEAIYDELENNKVIIIGSSGHGFYEKAKATNVGVSALAINTNGRVNWHIATEAGIEEKPYETAKNCVNKLKSVLKTTVPAFYYMASNFRTDSTKLLQALNDNIDAPVAGGLSADDFAGKKSFVFANNQVLKDHIAILAAEGQIQFDIQIAQNLQPVGSSGEITHYEGVTLQKINGMPAMDFIAKELGKSLESIDQGNITLKLFNPEKRDEYRIRAFSLPADNMHGILNLSGGIDKGDHAQICLGPPDKLMQDITKISETINKLAFKPEAALIISCAGRKRVLADEIEAEIEQLVSGCPSLTAVAGFPSYGEIGPVKNNKGYSSVLFHNMSFILIVFGD